MPKYDIQCEKCDHVFEVTIPASEASGYTPPCPKCESNFTKIVWLAMPRSGNLAKDPYDYLHGYRPDRSAPIKSFANDKRKGGKDTT